MNTDYWCFGSRYPRSTRNNNPLIHLDRSSSRYTNILQHGKSFSSKNLCNFDRETNKVGSGFLIFFNDRSYSLSSKVGLTPSRLSPGTFSRSREADPVSDRSQQRIFRDRWESWSCRAGGNGEYGTRRHRTIEWNDRSDCFVLSSASQAGRPGRRVTWTSMATERSGLVGNTSFRLSGIFQVFVISMTCLFFF